MNNSKFKVNELVYHVTKDKPGKVTDVWYDGEQFRYYVQHSGHIWSVPESALIFAPNKNNKLET